MPLLRSLRIFGTDVLQICRAYGAGFADERPANPVLVLPKTRRALLLAKWLMRNHGGKPNCRAKFSIESGSVTINAKAIRFLSGFLKGS